MIIGWRRSGDVQTGAPEGPGDVPCTVSSLILEEASGHPVVVAGRGTVAPAGHG
jgi:hypothetical protein